MESTVSFRINMVDNATGAIKGLSGNFDAAKGAVDRMQESVRGAGGALDRLANSSLQFNQITQVISGFSNMMQGAIQPGVELNTSLADLSAITNVAGEGLKEIEGYARDAAMTFGGSAANSVENYKLLLSQLSPEIAKVPEALKEMGDNVNILSKTMGGDTKAATEVLTTAMNQFQVSTEDPIKAADEMADMMNIMAAAAKEGSAELPQIKDALSQAGMAAKMSGVSFAETNAAIQVLDKAGKKGAEGGVALRNVMATLAQGRFLPKDVQEELQAAGVDVNTLTDKSLTLGDRLRPLQGVMNDTALIAKLFGKENSNAALAIISGVDQMDTYTEAITGTNTAVEQANIIMDSYAEKQARIQAKIDNLKISVFNLTGGFSMYAGIVTNALVPLAQVFPLFISLGRGVKFLYNNIDTCTDWFKRMSKIFGYHMMFMKADLKSAAAAAIRFGTSMKAAALSVWRFGTVGIFNALKGMGAFIMSLVTGGATSASFAAISATSFGIAGTSFSAMCTSISASMKQIPIYGWIIAIISVLIALGVYLWQTSATFKAVLVGAWEWIKAVFSNAGTMISEVAGGILEVLRGVFNPLNWFSDDYSFGAAFDRILNSVGKYGKDLSQAYTEGKNNSLKQSAAEAEEKKDEEEAQNNGMTPQAYKKAKEKAAKKGISIEEYLEKNPGGVDMDDFKNLDIDNTTELTPLPPSPLPLPPTAADSTGGGGGGDGKIKNITIDIGSLIGGNIIINATTITEAAGKMKDIVMQELVAAVNDSSNAID